MNFNDLIQNPNNQNIDEAINLLQNTIDKYPYFSTAYILLLKFQKKQNKNIEADFQKYLWYIPQPQKTFIDLFLKNEKTPPTEKKEIKTTKKQIKKTKSEFDPELYQRAKKHHKQVIEDIIKPKTEKLSQLATLLKEHIKNQQEQTKSTEKQATDESKTPQQTTIAAPEKTQQSPETKTPESTEKQATDETKTKKQSPRDKTVEDIFKKIEELKKAKLKATEHYKNKLNKLQENVSARIQREEEKPDQKEKIEISPTEPQQQKNIPKQEIKQETINQIEPQKQTKQENTSEQKIEIKQTEKTQDINKTQNTKTKQTTLTEKENKQEAKVEKTTKSKSAADKILEKLRANKDNRETSTPKTQPPQEKKSTITAEEILNKLRSEKKEKKQTVEFSTPQTTKEETNPKLSAADKILQQIQERKRKKAQQEEIIDKFLETQPKINKNKEPKLKGDLAEKSTSEPDVATERLAEIYTLQGFKDKAIAVYEKLILKFPEKKDYFAQKIQELKNEN